MAKPRRNAHVKLLGVVRRRRPALLVSTALCATVTMVVSLPAVAQPAPNARPTGGVVVGGAASISQSASQTTIDQSTQRGAINWQSFNVGSQQSVQFNQPSSSSMTLNKVVGPNPSQIAGKIDANGQIILENQSGVMFYKGSQVNTAGLMVSAATSSNGAMQAFVNGGNLVMDQAANPNAAVVNQGHISIKQAGLAALVAPQVVNSGVITARLGHVVLAGATRTTLDLYGDGMMSIDVTGQVATLPNGATALVTNSGIIVADGGTVQLTARAADGLVTTLVNAGGRIQANSVGGHVGTVTLNGVGGGITVEGQLDAIGTAPGTKGGNIEVNATGNVTVASAARIDASGQAGGGVIAIGTTLKRAAGGPSVTTTHTAANVTVQRGASIAANATHKGNGGRVTVLSTGTTTMNGTISAKGGPLGGNGGFVELSGGNVTSATGLVDVSAPFGSVGTILLDPDNLDIVGSGGNQDGTFSGTITTGQDGTSTDSLSGSVLNSFTGDVLLQAKLTIDVQSSFSLTAGSLTMEAGQIISVDSGVNVGASGDIILATGGAGPGTPPAAQANPTITIDGSLASSGGSVSLLAGVGGSIVFGNAGLVQAANSKTVTLQGDSMAFNNGKVIATGGTIEIAPATSGNAMAFAATGTTTLTVPTLQPGSIVASTLRLGAVTVGGTLTTTAGSITFDKGVNLTGVASTLDLETTGTVSQTSTGSLTAGTLTGNVTGAVMLNQAEDNHIGTVGSFNAGGVVFALISTGALTVTGPVVSPAIQIENDTNLMSVTGSLGGSVLISLQTLGSLSVGTGAILNSPSVALSGVRGIALTGSTVVGQTGATVDLSAAQGNVTEANTGTIIAATLQSYHGVSGTADLRGTANAIGSIGTFAGFAVTNGDFLLTDTSPLEVKGALSAGGSIYLQTSDGVLGITIDSGATVAAGSSSLVSFQTDRFTNSGTVTGGTFELAPNTSGREVTIGGDGDLPSLNGIGAQSVRIGAVTVPGSGLTTTAGSIVVDGTFGASTVALELDSTGGIDGSGFALTASTLSGSAATTTSGDANFSAANTIGTLGNFVVGGTASSGNFNLVNVGSVAVTGSVSAANVTINADTIGINGGSIVTPGTGSLGLTSTVGAIALTGTALLNGGTVALSSNQGIAEATTSTIIATSLTASAASGGIVLGSLTNAIGTVTGMSATGGGVTLVVDPTTVLTGLYTGDDLFFEVAHNGGTLQLGDSATGATMTATAASNPTISFVADNVTEGAAGSTVSATDGSNGGTVEIAPFTSATAISLGGTFGASALVVDQTLLADITTGTGGLLRIGDYTGGSVTAGNISLDGSVNLGGVASTLELDSSTGSITEAGSIVLTAATLTGTAAGNVTLLGSNNAVGTLAGFALSSGSLQLLDTGNIEVIGSVGAANVAITAGTIGVDSSIVASGSLGLTATVAGIGLNSGVFLSAGTLDLSAPNGGVTEVNTGTVIAGTLVSGLGVLNTVTLLSANNTIGVLGAFVVTSGDLDLNDTGRLAVAGVVGAQDIALDAGTISIAGTLNAGTVLALGASAGGITESGVINAPTLTSNGVGTGTIVGGATLTGTNTIASLGTVTVSGGDFTLDDTGTLDVAGIVGAPNIALNAGSIVIDGTLNAGTLLALGGSLGAGGFSVFEDASAAINAGTVSSIGTLAGGLALGQGANTIGALGTITAASEEIVVVDTGSLSVAGVVTGPIISLTAGTIGIPGTLHGSTGVNLTASAGGVAESGSGLINTPLLEAPGNIVGGATLTGSNAIGTLDDFAVSGGDLILNDTGLLSIGAVTAPNITLNAGTISVAGTLIAGTVLALGASAGGITEAGMISAPTLTSSGAGTGTIVGGATLTGSNTIAALDSFILSSGSFDLLDAGATSLAVNGPVSAPGVSITGTGTTTINSGVTATSGTLFLNSGSIAFTSSGLLSGGVVDLNATSGGITEGSGSISATTLQSSNGVTGNADLGGSNLVGTLGAFSTTAGFALTDNEALVVNGPVTDTGASSTLALTTTMGGITLAGAVSATNVLDLDSAGSIDQTGGSISAGTLIGSASTLASLLMSTNVVGTLGAFTVTGGDLLLVDDSNLTIAGSVGATDIFAKIDLGGGTLTLGDSTTGATLTASGTISLVADNITEGSATSTITALDRGVGGTVDIAPFTAGTPVSLGASPATGTGTLVVDSTLLADISTGATGTLRIGSYNDLANGGTVATTAGNISVDGPVSLTGSQAATLRLDSTGSIYESGANSIQVATLVGSVVAGATLANASTIATLGSFTAGGTFDLVDSGAPSLAVTGPVTATGVTITGADTTTVTGTVTGASGSNVFVSSGSIALAGGVLTGGTVDINGITGGITESLGGSIVADTLTGSLGSTGNVDLGDANSVGTLANFLVNSGTFHLDNGGTVGLAVNGAVIASSVTLDNVGGTLAVNGTILGGSIVGSSTFATGLVSLAGTGPTSVIDLNTGSSVDGATIELNTGSVVMSGSALLGDPLALIEVTTTGGGVNEAGTATILAATLEGLGTIDGNVILAGAGNTIAAISSLAVTNAGTFSLVDNGNLGVGTLTASSITIGDAGTLTVTDSLVATTAVSLTASTILIPGEASDGGAGTTSLVATGGSIVEGGTLFAGTLSGSSTGATSLTGNTNTTNQVANLGSFTATGGFTLDDGEALAVAGPVNGGVSATILDAAALTVNGSVYSTNAISLTGSSIAINGSGYVSDGGTGSSTTSLIATNGSISETGTLIAGTLSGSSTGATSLTGATTITNQLLNLGSFTATGGLVLDDGEALAVAGPVNGGSSATIFDAQALTVNGSLFSAGAISLTGSSIAITSGGYVSDGGSGTTSLIATNGTINETGTLIAGTLSGSASNGGTVSTTVNLAGASAIANQVGTLGSFIASSFNLNDGTSLAVNGRLGDDTSVTIALPSSAALTINGTIIPVVLSGTVPSATNLSLTAGSITIPGTVSDGGAGTTSLIASNGSIGETGTLIAGALSGSSTGATSLTGATAITNHVGTLGSFSAAGFVLDDGTALTVAGPVDGGTSATILDAQALTVNGSLFSSNVISLTGSSIAITDTGYVSDGGSGTTSLIATSGTINETGTLIAGTLSGSSTGVTDLAGATATVNRVANLGSFSASSFALDDGIALAVAGPVNGGTSASILDAAALTVSGSVVSTSAISLTGSSIAITGTGYVSDGGAGTTSLVATNGTISETGTLIAGTLSGSSTGATSLAGATTTINQVANLGSFSADGFLLNDGIALAVAGPVNGGTSATILDAQALTVNGSVFSTSAISLTGSSIAINGAGYVSDGGAGTTSLIATNGTINEIGTLIAGTLSGSSTGATNLAGATATTNQVANLGSFSATAGNFILDDGESLTVAGSINSGGTIIIGDTGGFTNNATISSTSNTTITATGSLTNNGQIGEAGGNVLLSAGLDIANDGLIFGLQNGTLSAGADISNNGSIGFGGTATLIAVGSINDESDGVITAGGVGPAVLLVAQTGSITEASGGTIAATNLSGADVQLTAESTTNGNIVVAGAITAAGSLGVVGLTAGGSITQNGGSIVAGGPGAIGGTLVPSISLVAQTGTIGQSAGAVISATNAAGAIQVAAHGNIAFAGTISAPGTASVVSLASGATIAETAATGILQAGTLIGSAGNGATLAATSGTGNLVANLGSFTTGTAGAGDFVLVDGESLTVLAPVVADNGSVAITGTHFGTLAASSLTNNSTIQASSNVTLLADDNITNIGSVVAQGGTVSATATAGTLATSGLVQASTSATLLAGTDLTNTGSVIAQTGDVSLTATTGTLTNNFAGAVHGNATLMAGTDISNTLVSVGVNALLSADGSIGNISVVAGGDATLTAGGGITNSGVSAGGSASLTASTLDIINMGGGVTATAGSATLTATLGNITTSAGISAGTAASLTAGSNVTNTSSVIAQGGTVSVTASAGTLATSGLIQASTNATLLAGTDLTNTGSVMAVNGDVSLTSTTGTLTNNFAGAAHGNATLMAGTDISNTLVSVGVNALLSADGSIGNISVVAGGDATLTAGGGITNSGVSAGGSASLTASTLDITNTGSGVTATAGSATLTATLGNITTSAGISAGTAASLTAGSSVTNTSSVIAQGGTVSVTASAGTLATSGLIQASTNATLLAGTDLTNTGSVMAVNGDVSLTTSTGALTNGGLILARTNATLLAGTDLTNTGSVIAQTSYASLTASTGALTNNGLVQASTSTTLLAGTDLTNTGSVIAQTGNATLTASIGTVSPGALSNSGLISAPATGAVIALTANNGPIIQSGGSAAIVAGGSVVMNATGGITLSGLVSDDTGVSLNSGGAIYQYGTLIADLLTGSAGGTVDLAGAISTTNQVANLGNFTAAGTFTLNDGINLLISGVVDAAKIIINDGSNTISLGNGGFDTDGVNRPQGALTVSQLPTAASTTPGAYLAAGNVIQTGSSFTVDNTHSGSESILSIILPATAGGTVQFNSGGLVATNTWLILSVGNGAAGGPIFVKALDFAYSPPPGRADFTGLINGLSGAAAAGTAFIQPQPNSSFRVDGCPIHSVNCVLLATQGVPAAPPLNEINVGAPLNQQNPEDLVLPVVSDERYELVPCDNPTDEKGCPAVAKPQSPQSPQSH